MAQKIVPIIMAGGAGTRLWPVSRDSMPKQFIALLDGTTSTFTATLERLKDPRFDKPIVVTNEGFRFVCAEQMMAAGVEGDIVLEPERRDSAAAVAVGALLAQRRDPDAICAVLASDHAIPDGEAFVADCILAAREARKGLIMTLGIRPSFAATGYGYIQAGGELSDPRAHRIERFVEKPNAETAERYVAEGLVWNSGNFIFGAATMVAELQRFAPKVVEAAEGAIEGAVKDLDFIRLDKTAFAASPKVSIDYAVMEKTSHAGVVSALFAWSDIGSWDALHSIGTQDEAGNTLQGDVEVLDTENTLVRSDDVLTTVVGIKDAIVVTTADAVLVASKESAGKVKDLVAKLTTEGRREAREHLRMYRPWGWYQRIDIGPRFQVKHICVHPGQVLSLQKHFHRAEHWVVIQGTAEVTIDDTVKLYHENEAAYLPIGCVHRMRNPGKIDLRIIEVQVGSYTGEDDIVRIEDIYARAGT